MDQNENEFSESTKSIALLLKIVFIVFFFATDLKLMKLSEPGAARMLPIVLTIGMVFVPAEAAVLICALIAACAWKYILIIWLL
jgi:hypothetical protein